MPVPDGRPVKRALDSRAYAVALGVLLLLAGCQAPDQVAINPAVGRVAGGERLLEGLVIAEDHSPLAGVQVELVEFGTNGTTDQTGRYGFVGVDAGDYLARATHEKYRTLMQRASVGYGPIYLLDFVLEEKPTGAPYNETQVVHALVSCAAVVWTDHFGEVRADCGTGDPNNARQHEYDFDPYAGDILIEADWAPTTPCGDILYLLVRADTETGGSIIVAETAIRPGSQVKVPMSAIGYLEDTGGRLRLTLGAEPCTERGSGVAFQQRVDVYLTSFYFSNAPDGFTART